MALFASACRVKDPCDDYLLGRLENFLKEDGAHQIAYRSNQEPSIVACIDKALKNCRTSGQILKAAPEHSGVGESQSNGIAERSVQQFENQLYTLEGSARGTRWFEAACVSSSYDVAYSTCGFNLQSPVNKCRWPHSPRIPPGEKIEWAYGRVWRKGGVFRAQEVESQIGFALESWILNWYLRRIK